jgi:hypothetical protein
MPRMTVSTNANRDTEMTKATIRLAALARAARIVHARDAGETWAVIAAAHGMTRQRAAQVYAWGERQRLAAFASRDTDTLTALTPEPEPWAVVYVPETPAPKPED